MYGLCFWRWYGVPDSGITMVSMAPGRTAGFASQGERTQAKVFRR